MASITTIPKSWEILGSCTFFIHFYVISCHGPPTLAACAAVVARQPAWNSLHVVLPKDPEWTILQNHELSLDANLLRIAIDLQQNHKIQRIKGSNEITQGHALDACMDKAIASCSCEFREVFSAPAAGHSPVLQTLPFLLQLQQCGFSLCGSRAVVSKFGASELDGLLGVLRKI